MTRARHLSVEDAQQARSDFSKQFVVSGSGCWEWSGSTHDFGYGLLRVAGLPGFRAHRLSWLLHKGELGPDEYVLHRCDNPPCVNPDHLFKGSRADNASDKTRKGRARGGSSKGVKNPSAKLSPDDVREIRRLAANGVSCRSLGARYGVTGTAINWVVIRKNWRHIQ